MGVCACLFLYYQVHVASGDHKLVSFPREIDLALDLVVGADLEQAVLLQLDDLEREVGAEAVLVKLDPARQAPHLHL